MTHNILEICLKLSIAKWIAACVLAASATLLAKPALRWLDIHVTAEVGKDLISKLTSDEDWSHLPPLPVSADYGWLKQAGTRPLVAHALGEASLPGQNTLPAMERALASGLPLLELDLWLDQEGRLRCHHGPQAPSDWQPGDCDFSTVLQRAVAAGAYVIPDLKTDFVTTGNALIAQLHFNDYVRHVVFQLYRPEHMHVFRAWSQLHPHLRVPLSQATLPVVPLNHVAVNAVRAGIRAFTVPIYLRAAMPAMPDGVVVFVHPVHIAMTCMMCLKAMGSIFSLHC